MKVRKTSNANRDLKHLYRMVAAYDRLAAIRMTRGFDSAFKRLGQYPQLGLDWSELGDGIRRTFSGINVIIYRVENAEILILRVIDGRMDVEAEFRDFE